MSEAAPLPLDTGKLRELYGKAAEGPWFIRALPTDDGLLVIDDGRHHGMFPVKGEAHEIRLIAAMHEAFPLLLDKAEEAGRLERETANAWRMVDVHIGVIASKTDRLKAAEAQAQALREALKPFATDYDEAWSPENNDGYEFADDHMIEDGSTALTVGDLRRARSTLSQGGLECRVN